MQKVTILTELEQAYDLSALRMINNNALLYAKVSLPSLSC
jgi:hypothetical protein